MFETTTQSIIQLLGLSINLSLSHLWMPQKCIWKKDAKNMDFIHTGWNCAILTIGQTAKTSSSAGAGSNSSAAFKTLLHFIIPLIPTTWTVFYPLQYKSQKNLQLNPITSLFPKIFHLFVFAKAIHFGGFRPRHMSHQLATNIRGIREWSPMKHQDFVVFPSLSLDARILTRNGMNVGTMYWCSFFKNEPMNCLDFGKWRPENIYTSWMNITKHVAHNI